MTVTLASDNGEVSFDPAKLTFTPADYGEKTVTVTGAADDNDSTDDTATIVHTTASSDGRHGGRSASLAVTDACAWPVCREGPGEHFPTMAMRGPGTSESS